MREHLNLAPPEIVPSWRKKNDQQYYEDPQSKHKANFDPVAIFDQTRGKIEKDDSLFPENRNQRHTSKTLLR